MDEQRLAAAFEAMSLKEARAPMSALFMEAMAACEAPAPAPSVTPKECEHHRSQQTVTKVESGWVTVQCQCGIFWAIRRA